MRLSSASADSAQCKVWESTDSRAFFFLNSFLKGEKAIDRLNAALNSRVNSSSNIVRHVIVRQTMDPDKTYYIKFKSVLDRTTAEFYMDGLEFCPKAVYDNPNEPEDIW